jgi:hypothetical protein
VVEDLIDMGRRHPGLLEGLPVEVLGRMRTDRVMRATTAPLARWPGTVSILV